MVDHIAGRQTITDAIVRELFGPAPVGRPLDIKRPLAFEKKQDAYGPWTVEGSLEEILDRDPPTRRYGVGVLFPISERGVDGPELSPTVDQYEETSEGLTEHALEDLEEIAKRTEAPSDDDLGGEAEEFDLTAANDRRQSAVAVSFLARLTEASVFRASVRGGRYYPVEVTVEGRPRTWWARQGVSVNAEFDLAALARKQRAMAVGEVNSSDDLGPIQLKVSAISRPHGADEWLVTAFVTNISPRASGIELDARCFFQTEFEVELAAATGKGAIVPYPEHVGGEDASAIDEDQSFELLYRDAKTFAIGHGCAGDWAADADGERAVFVRGVLLPMYHAPSVTPDIKDSSGKLIRPSMAKLAGLDPSDDGFSTVDAMLAGYETWIAGLKPLEAPPHLVEVAKSHVVKCQDALGRMRRGIEFVKSDPAAARAFRLANEAVLKQQLMSRRQPRALEVSPSGYKFREPIAEPDWKAEAKRGYWRPFQLGFLLATVTSIALADDVDRERVDLVFFPTGGGKTEAYLGQTAFAIFYRRIKNPDDLGVQVLMRYTLRLLTTQQFQRASSLICAMELIRTREADLGEEISIGIWLGGSMTPNRREDAKAALRTLRGGKKAKNKFLVRRCPWCAAQMGPQKGGTAKANPPGYVAAEDSVRFECPDRRCPFSRGLPVYVVDEDIYEKRPALVIGTVDKFARVAWRDDVRALFGIGPTGQRDSSPPGLIIQDELHLISGPLGSLTGLYETLIEELSTDRRGDRVVKPKIVASTATIRRLESQVKALFGRDAVGLFPPHGFRASDNFFAKYATDPNGNRLPGRMYVGVHAPALGSVQTAQVRTFATLLQSSLLLPDAEARDPWHTVLAFFNSLRELANSLTLLQSDIPDYLGVMQLRGSLPARRYLNHVKELTSRLTDDEVPAAIEDLERTTEIGGAVDVCLASSIIEVGVDIDRLSLITMVGQPKTTAQYIQVTGRIGRQWEDRPGLVLMVYGPTKARDRSHFERFRSYHEKLYASVEPTSLTPFAPPVLERALHAILVGYIRQFAPSGTAPWPRPTLVDSAGEILRERVAKVDPEEAAAVQQWVERRIKEWDRYQATVWDVYRWVEGQPDDPLIRGAGEWAPESARVRSWETLRSMRNVDATCQLRVTGAYAAAAASAVGAPSSGGTSADPEEGTLGNGD